MKTNLKPFDYYSALHYPVTLIQEAEGGYTAFIPDLPGCISVGETVEEAMAMIKDARQSWLEVAYNHGDDIPLPSTMEKFGGKVLVRMPPTLHRSLVEGAKREDVSLNQYVIMLLTEGSCLNTIRNEIRWGFVSVNANFSVLRNDMSSYEFSHRGSTRKPQDKEYKMYSMGKQYDPKIAA